MNPDFRLSHEADEGADDLSALSLDASFPPAALPASCLPAQLETSHSGLITGIVLAVQANYYFVQLDAAVVLPAAALGRLSLLCTRRSRLKKIGQKVMVGDRVQIEEPDWADGRGAIAQVFDRYTELERPPIANADQILLVFAMAEPTLDPMQLSRFLVKAESTGLGVCLCLNKRELVSAAEQQEWCDRIGNWGYEPICISLRQETNLDRLPVVLNHRITIVSGPSGVGKSSLINRLIPAVELRTGRVSGKLGRGRHTTRHVELFQLPMGGLLADSPGFNQPDLACMPTDLAYYFPEARQRLADHNCQFSNCLHRDEPNCVVRGDWERYHHYLTFLEEAIVYQQSIQQTRDVESTLKVKSTTAGKLKAEPKLSTKKYRRPSRRTEKQELRDLYQNDGEA